MQDYSAGVRVASLHTLHTVGGRTFFSVCVHTMYMCGKRQRKIEREMESRRYEGCKCQERRKIGMEMWKEKEEKIGGTAKMKAGKLLLLVILQRPL